MDALKIIKYRCRKCGRENASKEEADKCCILVTCSCGRGTYEYIPALKREQKCWRCKSEEEERNREEEFAAFNRAWH